MKFGNSKIAIDRMDLEEGYGMRTIEEVEKEINVLRAEMDSMLDEGIKDHVPTQEVLDISRKIDVLLMEHQRMMMNF